MFDSHAHYDDSQFNEDRDKILSTLQQEGVEYVLNAATCVKSAIDTIELSDRYDFIYSAVGIHPHEAEEMNEHSLILFEDMLKSKKVVAVGEIGLDYHYDFSPRETQRDVFKKQIDFAIQMKKPIIIHDREAHGDTIKILKEFDTKLYGGVFHCYSGSVEMAKEIIDMGFYISLGGAVTFKNTKTPLEVAKNIPIERLLVETDCPYMTPVPLRGKRNYSPYIKYILETISRVREMEYKELEYITTKNAKGLFSI